MRIDKNLKNQLFIVGGMVGLTCFLGFCCSNTKIVNGEYISDTVTIAVPSICTISSSGYDQVVELQNGLNRDGIGGATITMACNDVDGYALYAVGYSQNTEGNTNMTASPALGSTYDIVTGVATSGDVSNWSVRLSSSSNAIMIQNGFDTYRTIPSLSTKVASKVSGTNSMEEISINTDCQVYISATQVGGDYTGKIKYTLVYPSAENCPEGYANIDGVCMDNTSLDDIDDMQEMTESVCNATDIGSTKQLKDTRDNKYYWVAKIADGNCWMTQSLDLDLSTSVALTNLNTDLNGTTTSWTPSSSTSVTDINSTLTEDYATPVSYDPGNYYLANGVASVGTATNCNSSASGDVNCHYHQGNYYNWNAATAGSNASTIGNNAEAPNSICPRGWRLPEASFANSSSSKSWGYLIEQLGLTSDNVTGSPVFLNVSGSLDGPGYYLGLGETYGYFAGISYADYGLPYGYVVFAVSGGSNTAPYEAIGSAWHAMSVRCVNRNDE